MQAPQTPVNETERLQALYHLDILDTRDEERFDRLTRMARNFCDVPIALISLIDVNRQWFKSKQGLEACETPRDVSFCGHAILQKEIFYIPDATKDPRFADNPLVVGPPYVIAYAGVPLILENGYCVGTLCLIDNKPRQFTDEQLQVARDIAAVVLQELELKRIFFEASAYRDHDARLRALFDSVIDSIITLNSQGIIESANPATEKLLGYSTPELIGQHFSVLTFEAPGQELNNFLTDYLHTGIRKIIDVGHETIARHKNGAQLPVELSVSAMQIGDKKMFTCIVRDIRERKRIERLKSEFVSTVSHELRTPLTSIRGALGLVLGKASSGLSERVKVLLETANRNCERLSLLINDILDLEKIESGTLAFTMAPVDLVAISQQALSCHDSYASQLQVKLVLKDAPPQAPIMGDEHRLLQVFANLLSNAIKYSHVQGQVDVTITAVNQHFRVSVRDYGLGIPAAFHAQIFERFAQADSSDTRAKGGTGLGLSITKAIIERHHGEIGYHSIEGQGAEFYFELPSGKDMTHG